MTDIYCELIFLNNPQKVYISGNLIKGAVEFGMEKHRGIKEITLYFKGESYCEWKSKILKSKNKETVSFIANSKKLYCETQGAAVWHHLNNSTYLFKFQLEDNTPTSIKGTFGQIRYLISVTVIDDNDELIKEITEEITVIKRLDLQITNPTFRTHIRLLWSKQRIYYTCCCIHSSAIRVTCFYNNTLYFPGEKILVSLYIANTAVKTTTDFNLLLIRILRYFIGENRKLKKVEKRVIAYTNFTCFCGPHTKNEMLKIDVPATPPTDVSDKNITVEYQLKLTCSIGKHFKYRFVSSDSSVIIGSNDMSCLSDIIFKSANAGDNISLQRDEMQYPIMLENYSVVRDTVTDLQ